MQELTAKREPPFPRFNGWRFLAMVCLGLFILALPFAGLFFYQLANSEVNMAEAYFLQDKKKAAKLTEALRSVKQLKKDTALLGRQLRYYKKRTQSTITVSNTNENSVPLAQPFNRQQADFSSFGAWAVAGMRHYRNELNKVYTALGSGHQVK